MSSPAPPLGDADLEKQASGTTAANSENEEADAVGDLKEQDRYDSLQNKRSTSFAPMQAPTYRGDASGNGDGEPKITRTFSRRDPSQLTHHDSHIFGGDLQREQTELKLARFQSQQGKDVVTVHWEGEADPENPHNWGKLYRWYLTALAGFLVLNSTFTSSAPSGVVAGMIVTFGFSQEVAILTISAFVAGYCLGPLVWGPLSERYV